MTGGRVVILGEVGKNFGAGMSGGIAYVLTDNQDEFKSLCNKEMILFESLDSSNEENEVKELIKKHFEYTESAKAAFILENWEKFVSKFVKVIPKDFKRMMERIQEQRDAGLSEEEAVMSAFEANAKQEKKTSPTTKQQVVVQ
jgi:glutamate synthase (NADPH/NADH) large chain